MDSLSKNTRGLWTQASNKADDAWGSRKDADIEARRQPLATTVDEMRVRADEIKSRMAKHKVAREHALRVFAKESDPHTARLERFDMAFADEESRRSSCVFSKEERLKASLVDRHRIMWTEYGTNKMKPQTVARQDARCLRTGDIRLILLKMSRNPTDFAFQVRALERLSTLSAWHPETAKEAIDYGALKNAISMLKEALVFVGVLDLSLPNSPFSSSTFKSNLFSSSAASVASTTSTTTSSSKKVKSSLLEDSVVASPSCQNGALLVARPVLQLMATLCITSDAAVLQMTALGGFDYAAAALAYFPFDSTLQLSMCKLIRNRCVDRIGRLASSASQAAAQSSQSSFQSSNQSQRSVKLEVKMPAEISDVVSRLDFSMQSWSGTNGPIPDSLTILIKVLCSQLGLKLKHLSEEAAEIRKLAVKYLNEKPDSVIEPQALYPPVGETTDLIKELGEGTTSIPWLGEVSLLACIEGVEVVRPPDISVICAALLALKAFITNQDMNKEDSLEVGIIPLLLIIIRHYSHIDRITVPRRDAVSCTVLALDALWSLIWIDAEHSTKSAINTSYTTAVQVVASGGVCRIVEGNSVHSDEPMVATSSQQLLQALIAALASGPSKGGGVFGFRFTSAVEPQHSWHLRHCMAGSRSGLTVLIQGFKKWMSMAPLVVLMANNLSTVLSGTTSRDAGIIQSLLLALNLAEVLVPCMNFNLHDPIVTEALAKLMYCMVSCGPRGNILKNDLKRNKAGDALFKVGTVHEGINEHVMHWAETARYLIIRRLDDP